MTALRVASYNVRYFRDDKAAAARVVRAIGPDVLWLGLVRPDVANWWTWLALALTAGGFVLLVLRQPPGGDDDNGNGAVV